MDAVRRGIWCFYLSSSSPAAPNHPELLGLHARMEVCGYPLGLVGDGNLEPIGLLKNRPPGASSITTPSSSSSAGSAFEMTMRSVQTFNLPPTPVAADGKVAPSPLADVKGYSSVPAREIYEFFITAVLSSLTTYFCRNIGGIALNHRTVLLPQQALSLSDMDGNQTPRTSAVAAFRVYLTTTGSLVISLHVSMLHGLVSAADVLRSSLLPAGPIVLAAPFGTFGALQGVVDTANQAAESGFGHSPDTQVSRLGSAQSDRFLQWKTYCCKLLQMRGMSPSLLDGCSWLNIHFLQRKPYEQRADGKRTPSGSSGPTAPWPAVLCFRKPKLDAIIDAALDKALSAVGGDHMDPLSKARLWCRSASEREDAIARRKKEREAALAREHADPDTVRNPQGNAYSPMALWRSANGPPGPQSGSMYPTPPDGVHPSGVTPSFDGAAVLSPAGPPATNTLGDIDATRQQGAPAPDAFNAGWDGTEARPDQAANNFPEENIYGDLGANMFEGNELTDADFNFFDEQPATMDLDLPALPGTAPAFDMQENPDQAFAEHAQTAPIVEEGKAVPPSVSPQFTKPELKHARSTLAEERRQQTNIESFNLNSTIGIKRHPSPFNAETVFKRIRAPAQPPAPSMSTRGEASRRRPSLFEKVDFDPALSLASRKYQESGLFDIDLAALKFKENRALPNEDPLTIGRLLGPARQRRFLKQLPSGIGSLLAKMASASTSNLPQRDDAASDSDDASWASDDDDASGPLGRASSPARSSILRRRADDDVISMAASFKELDNISADSPGYGPPDLSRLSNLEIPELSLSKYFADPEPAPLGISASDDDFITVAQILTEQAATGFLKLAPQPPFSEIQEARRCLIKAIRYAVRGLKKSLPRSLAGAVGCQLRPFTEVQDVPLLVQPHSRVQVRPAEPPKPSIFTIPAPHVELRRYDNQISVLPSAVSFWETLGLRPVQGPKDIVAMCIFPHDEAMRDNASAFLDRVRSTYEALGLGAFEAQPTGGSIVDGVVLLTADQDIAPAGLSIPRARSAFTDQMANVAMTLANSAKTDKNFVVYFAYSPDNPSSIVDSCSAFQELYEHYKRHLMDRKRAIANELVLQLIPLDMLGSETSLFVLSPSDCSRLCLETYDRCTLFGGPMPSPAIILERALPRGIDFKLSAAPSPNLLRENSCMHIAYARSVDERWATAAWTDNRGSSQAMASYCLGRRGRPLSRQFAEVMHEIWDTTQDLISSCKVHWRIIITKCGLMDQQELDIWAALVQAETRSAVSLVLLTADTDPSLQLIPPAALVPLSAPSVFYSTPVSTPQPLSVFSPDQSSNNPSTPMAAATPGGDSHPSSAQQQQPPPPSEQDVDTTLVDTTETTHGVVISHRLNNSASLTELNPALASGYVIKRSGARAEDPPAVMEVNLIYCDNARAMYDALLREMLTYFRGLGTLARVRGVVERECDVRPWHVAAVEKAVRALYLLM